MASVNIDASQIRTLAADFESIPARATRNVARAVETVAKRGNTLAKGFARESSGRHGKLYPRAISAEGKGAEGLTWVYGPVSAMPQGGMSFEYGSRNQPPHLDLNRSADIIGPELSGKVGEAIDESFGGR